MRDMNPRSDRSIRNIPVPANHRRPDLVEDGYDEKSAPKTTHKRPRRRSFLRSRLGIISIGIAVVAIILGALLSTVFAGAAVAVTPRSLTVTPPSVISAQPNAPSGVLSYQIISTSRSASTTVAANGTQHVSRPATGTFTIYNNFSTESQRLISNTRFEAPDGKIYRIHDSVTVPGQTRAADGSLTPGIATVGAFADSPGDSYNRGATQLTIPGFKNDPRYTKFYAKTDQLSGGFVGEEVAVSAADMKAAQDVLKQGLDNALRTAAETQIPKEFLPIPGTLSISYGQITQTPADGGKATVAQTAVATANIVRATDLAAAIAKQTVQGYAGEAVGFADPSQISIAMSSTSASPSGVIQLQLSGSPTLVWQFDPKSLKQALLGKSKGSFEKIVQSFAPAIQCTTDTPCKASIRPFWASSFPSDPNKISVTDGK